MVYAYVAAFGTALFYGISAVLEDRAAKQTPVTGASGKRAAFRATVQPLYLIGMGLSVIAWALSLYALRSLPLFAVQAIAASSIGVVAVIVWVTTGHRHTRHEIILLGMLGLGLISLAISAAPSDPEPVTWRFGLGMWLLVALVAVAAVFATRVHGSRGAALLGLTSGLSDAGMAMCARAIHVQSFGELLTDPTALALLPFTVMGVVAFAAALQRGSAATALACQQSVATVVPSAIGLLVLGDQARSGFGPVTIVGFVVTVGTVIALTLAGTRAPAPLPVESAHGTRR